MVFPSRPQPVAVLEDISLFVEDGELVTVIGPSGCGKSTLFNILAGLLQPASGTILVNGREPRDRLGLLGYMPQKDLLMPWKSVLDNAAIGLELSGLSRKRARAKALSWFPRFGLEGFEGHYPADLSGGMRQRTALLRTFLCGRDVLLLDEPFGALDALTRLEMQQWLLDVRASFHKTIVLVTHDIEEAIFLADRVYVMTPRPGTMRHVIDVPLPRPRLYEDVMLSPDFMKLKRWLFEALERPSEVSG
jgi:ABC-type nitrate/sulfonate/bicarbonate transport system ATPase subunit